MVIKEASREVGSPQNSGILGISQGGGFMETLGTFCQVQEVQGFTFDYIRGLKHHLRPFEKWLAAHGKPVILVEISSMDIVEYLQDLKQRDYAPRTIKNKLLSLRSFFDWCIQWGFLKENPTARFKNPKVPKKRYKFVSQEGFAQMIDLCPLITYLGARRQAMLYFFATTGMRLNELSELKVSDVDMKARTVTIRKGKGQKSRVVPLLREAHLPLIRYMAYRKDNLEWLWLTEERRRIARDDIRKDMRRMMERAGIKGEFQGVCHALRRTFAANSIRQGIPTAYIKAVAGWDDGTMLAKYTASMEDESTEVMAAYQRFRVRA